VYAQLSFLKCVRLVRIRRLWELLSFRNAKFASVLAIIRLYALILLVVHWNSCIWFALITSPSSRWFVNSGMPDKNAFEQYTTVYFHNLGLLIRSSSYPPQTPTEEIFCIIISLLGACVQGTVFGQVAHLIASIDGQAALFNRQMRDIGDRMNYHGFPEMLQVIGLAVCNCMLMCVLGTLVALCTPVSGKNT
jgi:hypothetical protein